MSSGRWTKRGYAFQARADAGWALAGQPAPSPAIVTTRLTLIGTSKKRLTIGGTSKERLTLTGTSAERLTIEGASP